MKYKIITIKNVPIKERIEKLGISINQFGIELGKDKATVHYALNDKLILTEKTAQKFIKTVERFENNPKLVEKAKLETLKQGNRESVVTEEDIKEMIKMRMEGKTLQKIGDAFYGLTKERIRQIINISYVELRRLRASEVVVIK